MKVTIKYLKSKITILLSVMLIGNSCQNKSKSQNFELMNKAVSAINNAQAGMIIDPAVLLKRCDSIGDYQQKYLMVSNKLDAQQKEEAKTNLLKLDGIKVIYQTFDEQYATLDYDNQELDSKIKAAYEKLKKGITFPDDSIHFYIKQAKEREKLISLAITPITQVEYEYRRKIDFCKELFRVHKKTNPKDSVAIDSVRGE